MITIILLTYVCVSAVAEIVVKIVMLLRRNVFELFLQFIFMAATVSLMACLLDTTNNIVLPSGV